jgi:hypothetical protein
MKNLNNKQMKRIYAGLLAIMMLAVLMLSSMFIAIEANHHCEDDDCPICESIHQCLNILHGLGNKGAVSSVIIPVLAVLSISFLPVCDVRFATLVSRKVRLND